MASEASYVYILSGQKLIKNAKNVVFLRDLDTYKLAVKQFYLRILVENFKISKF